MRLYASRKIQLSVNFCKISFLFETKNCCKVFLITISLSSCSHIVDAQMADGWSTHRTPQNFAPKTVNIKQNLNNFFSTFFSTKILENISYPPPRIFNPLWIRIPHGRHWHNVTMKNDLQFVSLLTLLH